MPFSDYNGTNQTTSTARILHQNPPLDDLDEWAEMRKNWESIAAAMKILYDFNLAFAITLALISIAIFLTIFNKNVRSMSPMWYSYHLIVLCVFTALCLHVVTYTGQIVQNSGTCRFVVYSVEYVLFMLALNILLINVEVYLVYILPISLWQDNSFMRFLVSKLAGWVLVCFLVAHITIDNNEWKSNTFFCFHIPDEGIQKARFSLQEYVPALLCLIASAVIIATYFLRRSRNWFVEASSGLREMISLDTENILPWLLMTVGINVIFMTRTILMLVIRYGMPLSYDPDHHMKVMLLFFFHTLTIYALPLPLMFLPDVRLAIKEAVITFIAIVTAKVKANQETHNLRVTMETDSETA